MPLPLCVLVGRTERKSTQKANPRTHLDLQQPMGKYQSDRIQVIGEKLLIGQLAWHPGSPGIFPGISDTFSYIF